MTKEELYNKIEELAKDHWGNTTWQSAWGGRKINMNTCDEDQVCRQVFSLMQKYLDQEKISAGFEYNCGDFSDPPYAKYIQIGKFRAEINISGGYPSSLTRILETNKCQNDI